MLFFVSFPICDLWVQKSWSQEGEDMLLRRIFGKKIGFYVDVGAHHPLRFSNTHFFYRKGWRGINIDAMPGSMQAFKKLRPRDINLELGVSNHNINLDYYIFNDTALNSFSVKNFERIILSENNYHLKKVIKIKTKKLSEILDEYLKDRKIDFLNLDVEGLDLDVLQSNDWAQYRPTFILVEAQSSSLHNIDQNKIVQFMKQSGYNIYAKQVNTVFFKDSYIND